MAVTRETVIHTSRLARLDIAAGAKGGEAEAKLDEFAKQMDAIVGYMDILQQADTTGVEPMFSPMSLTGAPRADEEKRDCTREEVLANAPDQEDGFYVVPRVL